MLSHIVQNSNELIKSQYHDENSLLGQLVKLKNKRRNFSFLQPAQKRGSIFQQPQFMNRLTLNDFKKTQRTFYASQSYRVHSKSQESTKTQDKLRVVKPKRLKEQQNKTITEGRTTIQGLTVKQGKTSRTIHSRKNNEWFVANKNPKIHHESVFSKKDNFIKNNEIIQEPGFVNLCFYKNTLEQIDSVRSARLSSRRRSTPKKSERDSSMRNKIKFSKYKGILTDQNLECRPWSPKNESDMNESDFPYFRSLCVKI